jgi:hypothetical protein
MSYFWPASALTDEDMATLYRVRESLSPKIPITQLIAQAVRKVYMTVTVPAETPNPNPERKEAA